MEKKPIRATNEREVKNTMDFDESTIRGQKTVDCRLFYVI